ncbi:MAG: nuclear transport factor 2 family protein, partial [Pseudomonadota bacterium]
MSFQAEKALVLKHYEALAGAEPSCAATTLAKHTAPHWRFRGVHPIHEKVGAKAVAATFWSPFLAAFSKVQRRQDIFVAGLNEIDGFKGRWVLSMGHLMGLFDAPFLGIPPTRRIAMLRYAEFNKVEHGAITETAFFCDLLHLMAQAGLKPLPHETGAHLVQPGPATHDGLLFKDAPADEGHDTLTLINRMIFDINHHKRFGTPHQELAHTWHEDMVWWGPAGIGSTYTIDRYIEQHQGPFRRHIKDRRYNGHVCR